jgi:hypothetical protein
VRRNNRARLIRAMTITNTQTNRRREKANGRKKKVKAIKSATPVAVA